MASCCSFTDSAKAQFTAKDAEDNLARYRRNGPDITTRLLRDALTRAQLISGTVLDIGAGVGALSFELLEGGAVRATAVDAAEACIVAGRNEAVRRGQADRVSFTHGDFVTIARQIPAASLVVMDRVVCCYPAYEPLLNEALGHAGEAFAWSYPRDRWFIRAALTLENALRQLRSNPFRAFVHPVAEMQRMVRQAGFELVERQQTAKWATEVYRRAPH
jgi:cyclopropane fatty-acyl-phospholipid synthase-like methyltransferase